MRYLSDLDGYILVTLEPFVFVKNAKFIEKTGDLYLYQVDFALFQQEVSQGCSKRILFYLNRFILLLPEEHKREAHLWKEFYSCFAPNYEKLVNVENNLDCIAEMLAYFKRHLKEYQTSIILDYGCGTGLSSNVNFPGRIIGFEPVLEMRRQSLKKGMQVLQLEEIKRLPDQYFDAVFASYVFHMAVDEADIVSIMGKVRDDGIWIANYYKNRNIEYVNRIFENEGYEIQRINPSRERFGSVYAYKKRGRC